ncbi:MAG: PSD1 and planctomycete cytochrome C domain-containing protein [Rubripirellula sp.]|nr:PSD1 and planctomycete cytochrome C domain-containing protein [Rubripirellula sp.]
MTMILRLSLMTLVVFCCCQWTHATDALTYEQHIRPIFRAHCFDCHGATDELEGDLDLRLVRLMKKGGTSGPAIDLKDPDESFLLTRIRDGEMPPGEVKVSSQEIEIIYRWIAQGASTARLEADSIGVGLGVTLEERAHWAYQPIQQDLVFPTDRIRKDSLRNTIDLLVQWPTSEDQQAEILPQADRATLIKRAYFDLLGLPPPPEQMSRWLTDSRQDWYDHLLTHLLGMPAYGERWGRHWLDIAGYADSEGYTVTDAERPWAWKYRDWVIRALNQDKPFDQFITEQLAGDELAGVLEGDLTETQIDLLTATGYLRMAADGTGSGANDDAARNQVVTDTLKIVGTSLFGLSIQCAQCHDHRYDPVPQADYYSLRAIFEPALDWKAWKTPNARRISLYTAADRANAAAIEIEAKKVADQKSVKLAEYLQQALDKLLEKYDEPQRTQLRTAYETPAKERSAEQKQLLSANPSVNIRPIEISQYIPDSKPKLAEFDKQIQTIRSAKPVEQFIRALVEPANHVTETKLFHRGDPAQPKQVVSPGTLSVLAAGGKRAEFASDDTSLPSTGRRLAFSRWLTGPENPLLARVIANRIWMHHFGQGLVATPADFGKLGTQPADLRLLDWLANEFIERGWSMKQLHRLIMSSSVYRQVVGSGEPAFYRRSLRRLEAETIRDRMLAASGSLDETLYGPPLKIKEDDTGQVMVEGGQSRRSIYIQSRRSRPVGMLQTFDAPVMETNCEIRPSSTVATQSLMLLNGKFILDQASRLADRAAREVAEVRSEQRDLIADFLTRKPMWQYGYGWHDEEDNSATRFHPLPHWSGTQWQGSSQLPDPDLGYTLVSAGGGHPGSGKNAVIRRWTVPADGVIRITGALSHPSEHGDGVRGRIVTNRNGDTLGEWIAHNTSIETVVDGVQVFAGQTVDFITDCREGTNTDSFNWKTTIVLRQIDGSEQSIISEKCFNGSVDSYDAIAGQIIRAWELAYGRQPSNEELVMASKFIRNQLTILESSADHVPNGRTPAQQAMSSLCHSLFASNEFLYVE